MEKPYLIIHTHTSIDGKINKIDSPKFKPTTKFYQEVSVAPEETILNVDGYLNGRKSTDDNETYYRKPDLNEQAEMVPPGDYIANPDASVYYISIDPSGKLGWTTNKIEFGGVESPIISVLTEQVSNTYKDFLRRMNISYIIAGKETLNNELALHKLSTLFGIDRLMIAGGGTLNWSFLQAGLVDEISIVMGPFANGDFDMPGLFKATEPYSEIEPITFSLKDVQVVEDDVVWLRYTIDKKMTELE